MKKNAFTLIELLAVIVILAIIALIATPIVLNIIKESKESAQLQSANFYLDAVENAVASNALNNKKLENKTYKILKDGNICIEYKENVCINKLEVEVSGEIPISGTIILQDGKIEGTKLRYKNNKVITYDENKKLVYFIPVPYRESENIEIPDLYKNTLTPVIYDGDNWIIADVSEKWYNYSNQEWANAVILNSSVKKEIGDTITVDGENPDALAMFVWIPRYEYKIYSSREIGINFITKDIKEESDSYRIHPAFNFGGEEISGLWVGKFEISHATKTTTLGCTTETCIESDGLRILPNVQSLRNNSVSSFFYSIRSMSKEKNVFGIKLDLTDPHMIKNVEWGAVAYLSQSRYGKYGNNNYTGGNKEIYVNNSSSYYTGRSGGSYSNDTAANKIYLDQLDVTSKYNTYGYYTYDGYLLEYNTNNKTKTRDINRVASTTGNIYGIYDTSGGAWEYTMGVFANSDGEKYKGTSGFETAWPEEKYYDVYMASSGTTIDIATACNGGICYGHALSETTQWYGDYPGFVHASATWLIRGGIYSNDFTAGIFKREGCAGGVQATGSTRAVLTQAT